MVYLDSLREIPLYHLEGMTNGETASALLENSDKVCFDMSVALVIYYRNMDLACLKQ